MNFKSKATILAVIMTIAIGLSMIMAGATPSAKGPYVDEFSWEVIKSPAAQLIALTTHTVDCGGVPDPSAIPALKAAGFTITSTVKLGYNMLFTNNLLYPCDDVEMRRAIIRLVDKAALDELYYPVSRHMEYWLPESMPMWINRAAKLPLYNPVGADAILTAAGYVYSNVPTPPGWYDPGVPGSQPFYRIDQDTGERMAEFEFVTRPIEESPLYYELSVIINDKLHAMGIPSVLTPKSWEFIVPILTNSDPFDYQLLSGTGVVWGSLAPDILYSFLESSQFPLWNFWNFNVASCDFWCSAMKATLAPATLATAVNNIQLVANSEIPFVPLMEYHPYEAFAGSYGTNPGCIKIVNMKGVGATGTCPSDALAFGTLPITNEWGKEYGESRRIVGGNHIYKSYFGGEIDSLNPLMANTVPAWATLDVITGDFVRLNPYSLDYVWRVATGMPVTAPWTGPNGEVGMTLTYTLRSGVCWHDGFPVTAADCVFGLNLLRFQENERYRYVWEPIYDVVQTGPFTFTIWYLQRYCFAHEYFGISLLCPMQTWMPWLNNPPDDPLVIVPAAGPMDGDVWTSVGRHHSEFDPWEVAHPTVPGLTCLIGTDNFLYREGWDPGIGVYVEGWEDEILNYMDRINPGDCTLDGIVDLLDVWQVLYRQGDFRGRCYPVSIGGDPRWDPIADIAGTAQIIDGNEIFEVFTNFGQTWGP